jgi:hypothetical protein
MTKAAREWTIQGKKITMPVVVRDAGSGSAMFMVSSEAVQKLIPGDAFRVVEAAPGQTQCVLVIVDYRDNDLGDYDEVGIVFFVHPANGGPEDAGTYIYKLPVTQEFTREAGYEIWGFPKTVEDIQFEYSEGRASCSLSMDGQHVFTLSLPRGEGVPAEETHPLGYTYIDGVPHRTETSMGSGSTLVTPGSDHIELTLGTHPIADDLRSLGLPAPALLSSWMEHMSGTFEAPEKL